MVVLFLKESSIIITERISMDGGYYLRNLLSTDEEVDNIEKFHLNYMKETHWICFFDGQTRKFQYFTDIKPGKLSIRIIYYECGIIYCR